MNAWLTRDLHGYHAYGIHCEKPEGDTPWLSPDIDVPTYFIEHLHEEEIDRSLVLEPGGGPIEIEITRRSEDDI